LNSTQAALEEGIVPGGGIALLRASKAAQTPDIKGDELTGFQIVLKACEAPFKQIVQNTGFDSSLFLEKVLSQPINWGFNALTQQVEDLVKGGIIDPCKIIKHSLTTALSSAGMIILSEALIGHAQDEG
jgi:chaperonin GroEL